MNAFMLFGLLFCAIVAMVSGTPFEPEEAAPAAPEAMPLDDMLEGAESRHGGYGGGYGGHHGGGRYHRRHYYGR